MLRKYFQRSLLLHVITYLPPKCLKSAEEKWRKRTFFPKTRIQTILDKSPWDSIAIFIFFCQFSVPSWNSASFSKFSSSSPSPHPIQSWSSENILDTRVQHCLCGEGSGWTCANWKTPQIRKSVPRRLSMIVSQHIIICVLWWVLGFQRKQSPLFC